ncbi:hypothetical protein [Paenibacillus arenilitoris]|uniref:Uncharacterized protein n=1 Tax=Paenibacillus arenilitoris TaxID=2772299 RepID=A0A927CM08_9BACL|nr:hypothetical protein [Paenibacillus arenilitoris]MBD2870568.1 hypothetical protein [Paenibacillus arenilitoris]
MRTIVSVLAAAVIVWALFSFLIILPPKDGEASVKTQAITGKTYFYDAARKESNPWLEFLID